MRHTLVIWSYLAHCQRPFTFHKCLSQCCRQTYLISHWFRPGPFMPTSRRSRSHLTETCWVDTYHSYASVFVCWSRLPFFPATLINQCINDGASAFHHTQGPSWQEPSICDKLRQCPTKTFRSLDFIEKLLLKSKIDCSWLWFWVLHHFFWEVMFCVTPSWCQPFWANDDFQMWPATARRRLGTTSQRFATRRSPQLPSTRRPHQQKPRSQQLGRY